jgi:hypothetical protein
MTVTTNVWSGTLSHLCHAMLFLSMEIPECSSFKYEECSISLQLRATTGILNVYVFEDII